MKIDQRIIQRLEQLADDGNRAIKIQGYQDGFAELWNDNGQDYTKFYASALSLLISVFGEESTYVKQLQANNGVRNCILDASKNVGIVRAAKEDYENGYLFNAKSLIEAEVFDDFLEQAEELFKKNFYQPAAVVAGCVLEDALKKLCDKNGITLDAKATIDPANVALAKQGIYNSLMQKKILTMADLRNKAAHGKWTEFTKEDVGEMIKGVRSSWSNITFERINNARRDMACHVRWSRFWCDVLPATPMSGHGAPCPYTRLFFSPNLLR